MRTGIIGLGALGSSLGLALRAQKLWADVTGFDASARVQNEAKRKGAIREGTSDVADLLSDADVVVLAIPPLAVVEFLREYGPRLRADTVVTDVATSKQIILEAAERHVPARSGFVGGHPLVSSLPGIEHADLTLYRGHPWCLAAAIGTAGDRLETVSALVEAAGGRPYFVDAAEHDAWRELVRVSGAPFDNAVAAASGNTQEARDVALTSGAALVSWLDRTILELDRWREAVAKRRSDVLEQQFADAAALWERWREERKNQAVKGKGAP